MLVLKDAHFNCVLSIKMFSKSSYVSYNNVKFIPVKNLFNKPWIYIVIISFGLFFKIYKLENKFFWYDEVFTVIHTSGFQIAEPPVDEIWNIEQYRQNIRLGRDKFSIWSALEKQSLHPNLNPLHYAFLTFWVKIFGSELMTYRWFNIFVLLLTLPILFLLAKRLFLSDTAGWIAVSLYSCAPFINFFTQEARYPILWAFLVILSSYLLLESLQYKRISWWVFYTIAGILLMYVSILCGVVIIAHAMYVFVFNRKSFFPALLSAIVIFLFYAPWLYSLYMIREEVNTVLTWHSMMGQQNIWKLIVGQLFIPSNNLLTSNDFFTQIMNFLGGEYTNLEQGIYTKVLNVILPVIVLVSIIGTGLKQSKNSFWFIMFIVLTQFLLFVISDGIRGVSGSFLFRYQMIYMVGIYLFITGALSFYISKKKWWANALFIVFVGLSFWSSNNLIKNKCANQDTVCFEYIYNEAAMYDEAENALIITDYITKSQEGYSAIVPILELCKSDNIDILRAGENVDKILNEIECMNYSDIFIAYASDDLMKKMNAEYGDRLLKASQYPDWWTGVWRIDL